MQKYYTAIYIYRPQKSFVINHKLACDDKCLVYLVTCKICKKQYVVKPWIVFVGNNYRCNQRKAAQGEDHIQQQFHIHFYSEGHGGLEQDAVITLIDKTDCFDPTRLELFWIRKLETMHPKGLIVEESY